MKARQTLVSVLITFCFLAAPAIVGLYFALAYPEWPYFYMWVIAIGFWLYANALTALLYWVRVVPLRAFTFNTPLSFVLASLFVARDFPWWGMLLLALAMVLTAVPANMAVYRYGRRKQLLASRGGADHQAKF